MGNKRNLNNLVFINQRDSHGEPLVTAEALEEMIAGMDLSTLTPSVTGSYQNLSKLMEEAHKQSMAELVPLVMMAVEEISAAFTDVMEIISNRLCSPENGENTH